MINHLLLTNLDVRLNDHQLKEEVVKLWPSTFKDAESVSVKIFQERSKKLAVLSNFNEDFDLMELAVEDKKLCGRNIVMKPDLGELRNSNGSFIEKMDARTRRAKLLLFGVTSKKITQVFKDSFIQDIGYHNLELENKFLLVDSKKITDDLIQKPAISKWNVQLRYGRKLKNIQYTSVLGAIQAAKYFSGITTVYGKDEMAHVKLHSKTGLGKADNDGIDGLIPITQLQKEHRYIPLDEFDPDVINPGIHSKTFSPECWRCGSKFTLIGVDRNLGYIAGKCKCIYAGDPIPPPPPTTTTTTTTVDAYSWQIDKGKFTRLSGGEFQSNDSRKFSRLSVWYEPMRYKYTTVEEYTNIILPLIEEEWFVTSNTYRSNYRHEGEIISHHLVEILKNDEGDINIRRVYALEVNVGINKFWQNGNVVQSVKNLTLTMDLEKVENEHVVDILQKQRISARLWNATVGDEDGLKLSVAMECDDNLRPSDKSKIVLEPKPDKNHYETIRQLINNILKSSGSKNIKDCVTPNPFTYLFIKNDKKNKHCWEFDDSCRPISKPDEDGTIKNRIKQMLASLNPEQLLLVQRAKDYRVSLGQGPPGTGKTETATIACLQIHMQEEGIMIMTSPSNAAADGMAKRVFQKFQSLQFQPTVLRMMAHCKTHWIDKKRKPLLDENGVAPGDSFPYLHKLIQNDPEFDEPSEDPDLATALDHIYTGQDQLLTKGQRDAFTSHIRRLEKKILSQFDILVCTIDTLMDSRIKSLCSSGKQINTIMIEEAGQLLQPDILIVEHFQPLRVIFVGDHQQLAPYIESQPAVRSGFGMSQLEWVAPTQQVDPIDSENPPWTTLLEQYRMATDIREIVSNMTYKGKLRDGKLIQVRGYPLPSDIFLAFPQLQNSAVIVYNEISGHEKAVGTSTANEKEATRVITIVKRLCDFNINPQDIVILTLYDGQRLLILKRLHQLNISNVRVHNVDAFQGREEKIIILSMVRSNSRGNIGFGAVPNRINVSISRAMFHLFVVIDLNTYEKHESAVIQRMCQEFRKHEITLRRK